MAGDILNRGLSLDTVDRIEQLITQSLGIVDLMGNIDTDAEAFEDDSLNSAAWAVKDKLREIATLINQAPQLGKEVSHD